MCVYMHVHVFMCVFAKYRSGGVGAEGMTGFLGITPKGGEARERSLLYKHTSNVSSGGHPIAFYCDEFNIMMRRSR